MKSRLHSALLAALGVTVGLLDHAYAQTSPVFTSTQAENGKAAYMESCSQCHGNNLQGSQFAPALLGISFLERWAGQPVSELLTFMKTNMPPGNAGTLAASDYTEITAHILQTHGVQPGSVPLSSDNSVLSKILVPGKISLERIAAYPSGGLAPGVTLPSWPAAENLLKRMTRVTDAMLTNPPTGSWLSWRRTRDGLGFSPLTQINKENVQNLRVAWTLGLPTGSNQTTPLVHEGVIFVYSFGDHLQALDATTGDEIWLYSRKLPWGRAAIKHKNIAIYDNKIYIPTSDACMVALDIKTGKVIWEQSLGDMKSTSAAGGPLVAQDVVMQGLSASSGGGIIGLDAATGKTLWRFNSIAQRGDSNYNSWNGLPPEMRSGGSVWTAGSYDTELHLAYFGPAPTYDTGPLLNLVKQTGITNDALYTDTTLAIDPKTGKLAWYYQHMSNDQWNLDWAFERQIVLLPVNGRERKLVITTGKEAVYDALDAYTGDYVFSIDLGLQNLITSIDPKTGVKSIDPKLVPGSGKRITVCPHQGGGKNWLPASYDLISRMLYVPLVESCMDLIPATPTEGANLSSGVRWTLRPVPHSDGKYGRIQAINLETRQIVWTMRQRAPQTSGVLATSGGVLFAGALDRWFTAYDTQTGKRLWRTRVNDVPNAAPITYLAKGKQYVGLMVGIVHDGQAAMFPSLVPEISPPIAPTSAIWIFSLSE